VVGSPALVAAATFSSRRIHLIACSGDVVLQQLVRPSAGLDSPYGCITEVDPKARCLIEVGPRCPFVTIQVAWLGRVVGGLTCWGGVRLLSRRPIRL
jgi:hypothetical protein